MLSQQSRLKKDANCKLVGTPIDPSVKLVPNQEEWYSNPGRYRSLVGKLNYLIVTPLDIILEVSVVYSF